MGGENSMNVKEKMKRMCPCFIKTFIKTLLHLMQVLRKKEKILFELNTNIDGIEFFPQKELVSQNTSIYKNLVCIDGVGFCGSSAVGDFLGEFSNVTSLGGGGY